MRRPMAIALSLILASASLAAAAQETTTQLPRSVRPTHYDVAVVPHAQAMGFDGKVTVDIDVLQPTDRITLNAVDMQFTAVTLAPVKGKAAFAAPKVTVDADAQTATFTFAQPVPVGIYRLSMDYTGKIGTQANGLFALDYATPGGGSGRALYTQFENSDARRFIPSWDEPNAKATFDLQATVPSTQMAVSNMPVKASVPAGEGLTRVTFATSPKMSTYLLFFGLGDFDRATLQSDGTEVGVVARKGFAQQAQFALTSARDILHEYNGYFATPYPLCLLYTS